MGNKEGVGREEAELRMEHPQMQGARMAESRGERVVRVGVAMGEKEYNIWADGLLRYHRSTSKVLLPVRHSFGRGGYCGQLGTAEIYYPCFPYLLTQEIHDRRGRKQLFSEQELWYLLFSMSKAQRQNHPNDYIIGDIRPSNIFLNEEGSVKIANRDTWPYYKNKLEKALSNQPTYLAPEELRSIADNGKDFVKLEQQGEPFAIGLTLLSLVNLADYEGLYNLHKMTFDQAAFNEALTQASLNQNYSQVLRGLLVNLLSEQPQKRLDSQQLWTLLSKHEESIAKKNNFVIDNAPQKLHVGVQELRELIAGVFAKGQREVKAEQVQ